MAGAMEGAQGRDPFSGDVLVRLAALAVQLEDAGHYQAAQLLRVTADAVAARGAHPSTWERGEWFDALDPRTVLVQMRATPGIIAGCIAGLPERALRQRPPKGGWSLRDIVVHLRDTQDALAQSVHAILTRDNPELEPVAPFAWSSLAGDLPAPTADILDAYRASRAGTVERIEAIELEDWWRTGRHSAIGTVTLRRQVSYVATHEIGYVPQIKALAEAA
jgi:hypothetical protein